MDGENPIPKYVERYEPLLMGLASAAGDLTSRGEVAGIHFLLESVDAIFGRALALLQAGAGIDLERATCRSERAN